MATRMLQRRGTAAEWAAENPILEDGEIGFERDTKVFKLGDGLTAWNDLTMAFMPIGGGTFTGAVSLTAPTANAHAARKVDVDARVAKSGDTMTGALVMNEQRITRPELLGYQEHEVVESGATLTVDFHAGQLFRSSYSGALTVAWSNPPAAGKVRVATLLIPSTVTAVTWPGGTRFAAGEAPELDAETWISVVSRGTVVTVGAAWTGVA